jgi:hypothetical protein
MLLIKNISERIASFKYLWSTIFALSALEGLIALLAVASLPSDHQVVGSYLLESTAGNSSWSANFAL